MFERADFFEGGLPPEGGFSWNFHGLIPTEGVRIASCSFEKFDGIRRGTAVHKDEAGTFAGWDTKVGGLKVVVSTGFLVVGLRLTTKEMVGWVGRGEDQVVSVEKRGVFGKGVEAFRIVEIRINGLVHGCHVGGRGRFAVVGGFARIGIQDGRSLTPGCASAATE